MASTSWDYTADVSVDSTSSISSLYIYEDVNSQVSFDRNTGVKTVEGNKYSSDDNIKNLVLGYTKIKYKYEVTTKDSDNKSVTTTYYVYIEPVKVQYNKEVYKPGVIKIQMSVTGGLPKDYANILKQLFLPTTECKVTLVSCLDKTYNASPSDITAIYKRIALWYYVQNVSLSRRQDNSTIATLTCYSPDYKLTIDKYCQVFKGKKFSSDIFTSILTTEKGFTSTSAPTGETPSCFTQVEDLMYLRYNKSTLEVGAVGQEKITYGDETTAGTDGVVLAEGTTYTTDGGKTVITSDGKTAIAAGTKYQTVTRNDTQSDELIQPYLVQYNESFYDFICRVANRCGEFLYYEDGVLRLGLPEKTRFILSSNQLNTDSDNLKAIDVNTLHPVSVSYPEINLAESDTDKPELFLYDSCRYTKDDLLEAYTDRYKLDEKAYYRDKALKNETPDASTVVDKDKKYYVPEDAADEQLYHYSDRDIPEIKFWENSYSFVAGMSSFASSTSGTTGLVLLAVVVFLKYYGTKDYVDSLLNTFLTTRKKEIAKFENIILCKDVDNNNAEVVKQRSSILNSVYDNLCRRFFAKIKRCEEKVAKEKITLDFSTNTPDLSLCSPITLGDGINDAYIVTAMRGEFTKDSHSHTVEAIPVIKDSSSSQIDLERTRGTGSNAPSLIIPPYAVPHILSGSPQEAIVRDTRDPLMMGRVRITYLWQYVNPDKKIEVDITDDSDLDEGYSPWLRMATPFASGSGGFLMTPEIGSHVMVNYFNNNMENPYVEGALYTHDQSAPGFKWETENAIPWPTSFQPTAAPRVIQSASGHGITFTDGPDQNFFEDHVLTTIGQPVKALLKLAGLEDIYDKCSNGGMELTDSSGFYSIKMDSAARAININSPLGTVSMNAFTGITISAPNGDIKIEGKNITLSAGNNLKLESGTNVVKKAATTSETITGALAGITSGIMAPTLSFVNTTLKLSTGFNVAKFFDVSFLRAMWEVIMRPVEGTLSISTKRNIVMTAGLGRPIVPSYLMSTADTRLSLTGSQNLLLATDDPNNMVRITNMLQTLNDGIDETFAKAEKLKEEIKKNINQMYGWATRTKGSGAHWDAVVELDNTMTIFSKLEDKTKSQILTTVTQKDAKTLWHVHLSIHPKYMHFANEVIDAYNAAVTAYKALKAMQDAPKATLAKVLKQRISYCNSHYKWGEGVTIPESDLPDFNFYTADISTMFDGNQDGTFAILEPPLALKRKVFFRALSGSSKAIEMKNGDNDWTVNDVEGHWQAIINSLKEVEPAEKSTLATVGSVLYSGTIGAALDSVVEFAHLDDIPKLVNWNGCAGPRSREDVTTGGSVLISNEPGKTLRMNKQGSGFEPVKNPSIDTVKAFLRKFANHANPGEQFNIILPQDHGGNANNIMQRANSLRDQ